MFVHGWFHQDRAAHTGFAAIKAHHLTASEGEFLGLSRDVAAQRMADGRALIEDIIGRPVAGFVAPAWLYGDGARAALADSGFALAEDHFRVWRPAGGEVLGARAGGDLGKPQRVAAGQFADIRGVGPAHAKRVSSRADRRPPRRHRRPGAASLDRANLLRAGQRTPDRALR